MRLQKHVVLTPPKVGAILVVVEVFTEGKIEVLAVHLFNLVGFVFLRGGGGYWWFHNCGL